MTLVLSTYLLVFHLLHWLSQGHEELADMRPDGVGLTTVEVMQDVFLPGKSQHRDIRDTAHKYTHNDHLRLH